MLRRQKGRSRVSRICPDGNEPIALPIHRSPRMTTNATNAPTASPPRETWKKVNRAFEGENAPVRAAATANRKQTRPEASLSSASPSRRCIKREGIFTPRTEPERATASVGESTDASAKLIARGIVGMIQWMKYPAPTTVKTTSPTAMVRIGLRRLRNSARGNRKAST